MVSNVIILNKNLFIFRYQRAYRLTGNGGISGFDAMSLSEWLLKELFL